MGITIGADNGSYEKGTEVGDVNESPEDAQKANEEREKELEEQGLDPATIRASMTGTLETSDPNHPQDADAVTPSLEDPSLSKEDVGEVSGTKERAQEGQDPADPDADPDAGVANPLYREPEPTGSTGDEDEDAEAARRDAEDDGEPASKSIGGEDDHTTDEEADGSGDMTGTLDTTEAGTPPQDADAVTPSAEDPSRSVEDVENDVSDGEKEPEESYDPADHSVPEVEKYLSKASDAEKARVIEAEKSGKQRKGILDLA